ncbi:hypothetical protein LD13_gp200 [Bacillus phage Bobb]|uniref:Uncharacterized protein n=1 Tax=Bacillus phage Bobb TaxID=1527469 RepID=A0A076G7K3_9CAUD|nr:hypothetical protein LD13_gp200 [Bacillus phage Bobb]AII28101.1 hypothetical protein [Bacillus phage Bobb]
MSILKKIVYDKVYRLHDNNKRLEQNIRNLQSELRAQERRLARLEEEKKVSQEAVEEACETFGFVIGGYKDSSILDYESELFYDEETAQKAKEKTKAEADKEDFRKVEDSIKKDNIRIACESPCSGLEHEKNIENAIERGLFK